MSNIKLSIYEDKTAEPEKVVNLKLVMKRPLFGSQLLVCLVAVDENGKEYDAPNILNFTPDGKLNLCPRVNSDLGLKLDESGRIKLT